ncbi:hypothetical protein Rhe02_36910 [Rhizocola hellebori]|uniref:Uncharacterized protein n=1 Tax=Rhizocola hellebori TaxID=1392758 RepID=A0A8J3Q7U2_9ACTN|nr:hypothetical protein [Rhizocola hellebori]GIH05624.1 hypothetical protein Rhe02_36910 [Rhizocola hellebori]
MDDDDDELIGELSQAAELADPVPPYLVDAGIAAYTFRTIDAELAALVFDSAAAGSDQLVRSERPARMLSFETADLSIELEIIPQGEIIHLVGQILPPAVVQIDVRQPDLVSTGSTDGLGRFSLILPTPGPFQLSLPYAAAHGGAMVTEWISV